MSARERKVYLLGAAPARQVILHLQGLANPPAQSFDHAALYQLIEQLGFVQIDSIKWVERAHHMILFARNQTYRPGQLDFLVEKEQRLFENWTHDASFIPSCFFPYWRHKFKREAVQLQSRFAQWQGDGFMAHLDLLLERIAVDGALMSRDLERPANDLATKAMWQWHDGKAALEYLWRTGKLGVKARRNFQKIYDVTERCLCVDDHHRTVSHDDFVDWACRAALMRLGFGSAADIARFFDLVTPDEVKAWLACQGDESRCEVDVTGIDGKVRRLWARPDIEDIVATLQALPARARVLSPFDPVIRDRKRLSWLWGFDYRIEIYVPENKRLWGYYVFPILEADRLIGRVDMKAERESGQLTVRRLWLEPAISLTKARKARLEAELMRQARFCDLEGFDWNGAIAALPL